MLIKRKNKNKSLGGFFKKIFFWFLFMSFLGVSGWVIFFSNYTELQNVEFITDKLEKQPLEDISNNYRAEFWLKYWSKNNFFLFPRNNLVRTLKDQFKIIREVSFENKFPGALVVKIEERQGVIIWCSREQCFLMDETGVIFYQLQEGEKNERFKDYNIIKDNSNFKVTVGKKIEEGRLVNFVLETKDLLKREVDLEIQRELETPSLIAKEIRIKTLAGWQIYFNLENDLKVQASLLKELLKTSINQVERRKLNYIDLRISGKAIYKASVEKEIENNQENKTMSDKNYSEKN